MQGNQRITGAARPGLARPARGRAREGRLALLGVTRSFGLPVGRHIEPSTARGYYIDLAAKAQSPRWPPPHHGKPGSQLYVVPIQWALGAHERYLDGEGEEWLAGAVAAGEHLLAVQEEASGPLDGGFVHRFVLRHTFPLPPPWVSAMAQGEGASLLVRLYLATGREAYAEAARRALRPLAVPTVDGGVSAELGGRPFPEEYPTRPPSFVLNGAMFALWGLRDVGMALEDPAAMRAFEDGVDTLSANLHRWDTGSWSRYDLFPHPVTNVASLAYHELHVNQLRAMGVVAPRPAIEETRARFEQYAADRACAARAFARKALFRLVVPRNRWLVRRLPWARLPGS